MQVMERAFKVTFESFCETLHAPCVGLIKVYLILPFYLHFVICHV